MSAGRRIAKVEGSLSPVAATLLWLNDAHAFGTLPAYVGWLIDQPASAAPLDRVPAAAEAAVRVAMRGERRDAIERSVRDAVRHAVFLVELVIKLNMAAEKAVRMEAPCYAALFWEMRAISAEAKLKADAPPDGAGRPAQWAALRASAASLIGRLYAAEEAREHLERRCLDGSQTLFPGLLSDWQALREQTERLVGLGDLAVVAATGVAGVRQRRDPSSSRPAAKLRKLRAATRSRAAEEAKSLIDTARAAALDALGDIGGASTIVERRMRTER